MVVVAVVVVVAANNNKTAFQLKADHCQTNVLIYTRVTLTWDDLDLDILKMYPRTANEVRRSKHSQANRQTGHTDTLFSPVMLTTLAQWHWYRKLS